MDIAVDSSSLMLVADSGRLSELIDRLPEDARLVLPAETTAEFLSVGDRWIGARVDALVRIWQKLRYRLVLAARLQYFLSAETRESLATTPRVPGTAAIIESLAFAVRTGGDFSVMRAAIDDELKKDEHLNLDRSFSSAPAMIEWTPELVSAAAKFMSSEDGFWDGFFMNRVAHDEKHRNDMRAHPLRYRFAVTLAAYEFLNGLGTVANAAKCSFGALASVLRSPRRGDWVDARIAAASSYCDVILTDDRGMKSKVEYISRAFSFPLKAVVFDEWLSAFSR